MTVTSSFTPRSTAILQGGQFIDQIALTDLGTGGFMAVGHNATTVLGVPLHDIDLADFDAAGAPLGAITDGPNALNASMNPALDQMVNGRVAVVYESGANLRITIRNETGAEIVAPFAASVTGLDDASVAAIRPLAANPGSTGFVIAAHQDTGPTTNGTIVLLRYDQAGVAGASRAIDLGVADDVDPVVTQLAGGNIAVVWERGQAGGSTALITALFDRNLDVVRAPAILDGSGLHNRDAAVVATGTGFTVVYAEADTDGSSRISMVSLGAGGGVTGSRVLVTSAPGDARDVSGPCKVIALGDGLIAVAYQTSLGTQGGPDELAMEVIVVPDDAASAITPLPIAIFGAGSPFNDQGVGDLALSGGGIAAFANDLTSGRTEGEVLTFTLQHRSDGADDTLTATARAETFDGGAGRDTVSFENSTAGVTVTLGSDTAAGGFATGDLLTEVENLTGSAFGDELGGNGDDNSLTGGAGNDTMFGNAGQDRLEAGAGDDRLDGGLDDDSLTGGDGFDFLFGDTGRDRLAGGVGSDVLVGGGGDDSLTGDAGADSLLGGNGDDSLGGGGRRDRLGGDAGDDSLAGGGGADALEGGAGRDSLAGGGGRDRLDGGTGRDVMAGGGGRDLFVFGDGAGRDRVLDFRNGADRVDLADGLTFADLTERAIAGGVRLTLDAGDRIDLLGVTTAQIGAGDFL